MPPKESKPPGASGQPESLFQPWHLRSRSAIHAYVKSLEPEAHEWLLALYVDNKLNLLAVDAVRRGPISDGKVSLANVLSQGYKCKASGFFLVHNHPRGSLRPTPSDIAATNKLRRASAELGIPLVEHCIVFGDTITTIGGLDERGNSLPWPSNFIR